MGPQFGLESAAGRRADVGAALRDIMARQRLEFADAVDVLRELADRDRMTLAEAARTHNRSLEAAPRPSRRSV